MEALPEDLRGAALVGAYLEDCDLGSRD